MQNTKLTPYLAVAELIARTFPDAEVVLHDMAMPQHSVIYVANGNVTGRKVGQTFHHLIEKAVFAGNPEDGIVDNYFFKKDGKLIRSSSLLIRDEKRELIGALCINVDTSQASALMQLAENLLNGKRKSSEQEHLEQTPLALANSKEESVRQFVNTMVDSMVKELIVEGKNSREDRLELIRFMDERGVFLVKGSMEYVAGKLGLSKVTLYGYLDEIHGKR